MKNNYRQKQSFKYRYTESPIGNTEKIVNVIKYAYIHNIIFVINICNIYYYYINKIIS